MTYFEAIFRRNEAIFMRFRNFVKSLLNKGVYLCAVKQNEANEAIFEYWVL